MEKKKILFNKKAQVGAGLSWIVGAILIFFILLVFISFSLIIAGQKKIGIPKLEAGGNLANAEISLAVLKTPVQDCVSSSEFNSIKETDKNTYDKLIGSNYFNLIKVFLELSSQKGDIMGVCSKLLSDKNFLYLEGIYIEYPGLSITPETTGIVKFPILYNNKQKADFYFTYLSEDKSNLFKFEKIEVKK